MARKERTIGLNLLTNILKGFAAEKSTRRKQENEIAIIQETERAKALRPKPALSERQKLLKRGSSAIDVLMGKPEVGPATGEQARAGREFDLLNQLLGTKRKEKDGLSDEELIQGLLRGLPAESPEADDEGPSFLQGIVDAFTRTQGGAGGAEERVQVRDPQGETGSIPRSQVETARRQGFTILD